MAGNVLREIGDFFKSQSAKLRAGGRSGLNGAKKIGMGGVFGTSTLRGGRKAAGIGRRLISDAWKKGGKDGKGGFGAAAGAAWDQAGAWGKMGAHYFGAGDLAAAVGGPGGATRVGAAAARMGAAGAGIAAADFFNPFSFGWND